MEKPKFQSTEPKSESIVQYFPVEIISNILIRLPIKSLIKCTAVCKSWRSMIRNPSFIQEHYSHTIDSNCRNGTHLLLLHSVSGKRNCSLFDRVLVKGGQEDDYFSLYCDSRHAFDEYSRVELPIDLKQMMLNSCLRVVGTCNGLVCLVDELGYCGYSAVIWNPCVRKFVTLPGLDGVISSASRAFLGFGYDAMADDYKVVRLVTLSDPNLGFHEWPTVFQVYSLAKRSWSKLRDDIPLCQIFGCPSQAFVNGALHWSVIRQENDNFNWFVLAFDVGCELFREIMIPKSVKWDPSSALRISASGNGKSIAIFTDWSMNNGGYFLDIWVMGEYCVEKSWTKLISLSTQVPQRSLPKPLCFRKLGEVLVLADSYELLSVDKRRRYKNLGVYGGQYCSVDSYDESLVLLERDYGVSCSANK